MKLTIVFCRKCGYQDRAVELARDVLNFFDDVSVEIVPGDNGVFDVYLDGELIFSRHKERRFPLNEEVLSVIGKKRFEAV